MMIIMMIKDVAVADADSDHPTYHDDNPNVNDQDHQEHHAAAAVPLISNVDQTHGADVADHPTIVDENPIPDEDQKLREGAALIETFAQTAANVLKPKSSFNDPPADDDDVKGMKKMANAEVMSRSVGCPEINAAAGQGIPQGQRTLVTRKPKAYDHQAAANAIQQPNVDAAAASDDNPNINDQDQDQQFGDEVASIEPRTASGRGRRQNGG
ncbi:hypothetical protein ACH5RR_037954 [Cinchona calisaya]|uniref:Uncharacterized protein n=1 Tax=Cinchona calisaya TaxID=153742 RepID=A0ABD2YBB7_9GENT